MKKILVIRKCGYSPPLRQIARSFGITFCPKGLRRWLWSRPEGGIRKVRSYLRLRQDHIRASATQIHLMQKALTQMNLRIAYVINYIAGASGLRIIKAILEGERDAGTLTELCASQIKGNKREVVFKSLEGDY